MSRFFLFQSVGKIVLGVLGVVVVVTVIAVPTALYLKGRWNTFQSSQVQIKMSFFVVYKTLESNVPDSFVSFPLSLWFYFVDKAKSLLDKHLTFFCRTCSNAVTFRVYTSQLHRNPFSL